MKPAKAAPAVREASPRWSAARQPAVLLDVNTLVALGWAEHEAHAALQALCADAEHAYLAEHPAVTACNFGLLSGPRQTTEAYLLSLAQHHGMRLLTLDKRLAQAFAGGPFELLEVG